MNLILWELKKILAPTTARVALGLALLLSAAVALTSALSVETDTGVTLSPTAPQTATQHRTAVAPWEGPLTNQTLHAARVQFGLAHQPQNTNPATGSPTPQAVAAYITPARDLTDLYNALRPDAPADYQDYAAYIAAAETDPPTDFYAARQTALQALLATEQSDPAARTLLLALDAQAPTPYSYAYSENQQKFADNLIVTYLFFVILLCVAIAPLFAGEYQGNTAALTLATRRGRGKLAAAKLAAALLLGTAAYLVCMGVYVGLQLTFCGTHGLGTSLQTVQPFSVAPLTLGQAEAAALGLGLLGVLAAVGLTAALSAKLATPFPVIVIALGVLVLLPMFGGSSPGFLRDISRLLPLNNYYAALCARRVAHLPGLILWEPLAQAVVLPLYLVLALPLAARFYTHRQIT